jgi:hypothetical protein
MSSKKNIKKTRAFAVTALRAATLFAALSLNCGDGPAGPRPSRWEVVAEAPPGAENLLVVSENEVWLIGEEGPAEDAVIWGWDGQDFKASVRRPGPDVTFRDIDGRAGAAWVCGSRSERPGKYEPVVLRKTRTTWEELTDLPETGSGFSKVAAVDGKRAWLSGWDFIYYYQGGRWEKYSGFHNVGWLALQNENRLYAYDGFLFVILAYDGRIWVTEEPSSPPGFPFFPGRDAAATGESLYVSSSARPREDYDFEYKGILRRDGGAAAGEGEYELVFFAPRGPYFYNIMGIAFADDDNGVAVGYRTSVVCDDGAFYQEVYEAALGTPRAVAALGPDDYWMITETESRVKLLCRWKKLA